jgi:hypothetical protein
MLLNLQVRVQAIAAEIVREAVVVVPAAVEAAVDVVVADATVDAADVVATEVEGTADMVVAEVATNNWFTLGAATKVAAFFFAGNPIF